MTAFQQNTLNANGAGIDLYLKKDFVRDSQFPFDPGDTYVATIVPHQAVVLLPRTEAVDVDWPLTIQQPPEFPDGLTEAHR